MKWQTALAVSACVGMLTYGIVMVSEKSDAKIEQLQKQVAELEKCQDQLKQEQNETRKAAAVYETVARQVINGEW